MFNKLKQFFINLKEWLPILWEDRNYDQYFIYKVIHKKLELHEKYFRTKAYSIDSHVYATEIKMVRQALERVMEDDYLPWEKTSDLTKEYFEEEERLRQQDLDFIFDSLRENIEKWWD